MDQNQNLLDFLLSIFLGGMHLAIMVTTFLRSDTATSIFVATRFVCQLFQGGVYSKKCSELVPLSCGIGRVHIYISSDSQEEGQQCSQST